MTREVPDVDAAAIVMELDAGCAFIDAPQKFYSAFSEEECRSIRDLGLRAPEVAAGLSRPIEGYRVGYNAVIDRTPHSRWIYERVTAYVDRANLWYRFAISSIGESLLYCEYPLGGAFGWHIDCGDPPTGTRKISVSVQLSDEGDYTGGALEFAMRGEVPDARSIGCLVTFPSFMPHRVTTVRNGVRRALVAWMHGPVFR